MQWHWDGGLVFVWICFVMDWCMTKLTSIYTLRVQDVPTTTSSFSLCTNKPKNWMFWFSSISILYGSNIMAHEIITVTYCCCCFVVVTVRTSLQAIHALYCIEYEYVVVVQIKWRTCNFTKTGCTKDGMIRLHELLQRLMCILFYLESIWQLHTCIKFHFLYENSKQHSP